MFTASFFFSFQFQSIVKCLVEIMQVGDPPSAFSSKNGYLKCWLRRERIIFERKPLCIRLHHAGIHKYMWPLTPSRKIGLNESLSICTLWTMTGGFDFSCHLPVFKVLAKFCLKGEKWKIKRKNIYRLARWQKKKKIETQQLKKEIRRNIQNGVP